MTEPLRLNIGAGEQPIDGYVSLDRKLGHEAYPLPKHISIGVEQVELKDNSVDEIYSSHVLEHFSYAGTHLVLREWVRVLKPGGTIRLAVPNFDWIMANMDHPLAEGFLFGGHVDENDRHGALFTEAKLRKLMGVAGLVGIRPWTSEVEDCSSLPVSLNLQGTKADPIRGTPYAFSAPAYQNCYSIPDMAMDPRHVFVVHEILKVWPFKHALEIGSFCGASSTAFVEAINAGSQMVATFCDTQITRSLLDVAGNCKHPERARLTKDPSTHVLDCDEEFDFILVDAGHDLESVRHELGRLLIRKPLCVMAHDTNATAAGYPHAEGAKLLADTFRAWPEYRCIEDAEKRPAEQTHRGLFFATTDARLFELAKGIFKQYSE